jgi:hypothetical protein
VLPLPCTGPAPWRRHLVYLLGFCALAILTLAYGQVAATNYKPAAAFHLAKTGGRWWIEGPRGKTFILAASGVNSDQNGDGGGYLSYDAVYLQSATGQWSRKLTREAASTSPRDVVAFAESDTVHYAGDAIYLGSSRFRPEYTYFWLNRLGSHGSIRWYYGKAQGWRAINGNGKPFSGAPKDNRPSILDADGTYNLDIGGYMAPNPQGFGDWDNPNANRVTWWDVSEGLPPDFAARTIPPDPVPRFYIKGVVVKSFDTAPILNQTYERATLTDTIVKKYGPGKALDPYIAWAAAQTRRLRAWGFNAAGQYSYRYSQVAPSIKDPLPTLGIWQLSGWATRQDFPYHVKNVYAGAVCPPGSKDYIYEGTTADVFEPQFAIAFQTLVAKSASDTSAAATMWAILPEEADDLFGLNSKTHTHMGYVILSQNPHLTTDPRLNTRYSDPKLYAKFVLRDFLAKRYGHSLEQLNQAWGTSYSTWDTSSGDIEQGTNAYGTGSGFMDENGQHVYYPKEQSCQTGTHIQYDHTFTNPTHPAVRRDLDAFVRFFATKYGQILARAFSQIPHPPVLLPLYSGIDDAYSGLGPYVDGFWTNPADAKDALRIYNQARKPILVSDYASANPDSQLYFDARISTVTFNPPTNSTMIVADGIHYWFRSAWQVAFPSSATFHAGGLCANGPDSTPRIVAQHWDSVNVPGDYSRCVNVGDRIQLFVPPFETQPERARSMARRLDSMINLTGPDGTRFVVGFEHWTLYDDAVSNWGEINNFGLITLQDNAYDGKEARRAMTTDSNGRTVGGEEADYGNLLAPLISYLRTLQTKLR